MRTLYASDFEPNTFLDTLDGWEVALGVPFMRSNGTVWGKSGTNPVAHCLTLEANGLETRQEVSVQFSGLTTFQGGPIVFASDTGGLTGYMIGRTGASTLRVTRYVAGVGAIVINTITVSDDPVVALRAQIVAGNPEITVLLDGVGAATYTDTSANKLTTGRKGFGTTTISAFSPYGGPFITTNFGAEADALTISGPSACNTGIPSGPFTVAPNGGVSEAVEVTFADDGAGGTFTPPSLTFTDELPQEVTYTAATEGSVSLTVTNDGGLSNPAPLSVNVVGVPVFPAGMIGPGASWNGTAGSGGRKPVDPDRINAKPMVRLDIAPKQAFSDDLHIDIKAAAKGGIQRVLVRVEGIEKEITSPVLVSKTDRWGRTHHNFCYRITLDHSAFDQDGFFDVCYGAEAFDGSMQVRWMPPARFYRTSTPFSHYLQIAPSAAEEEGVSYQSLEAARDYLASQSGVTHPGIEIVESGDYEFGTPTTLPVPCWAKIFADPETVDVNFVGIPVAAGIAKAEIATGYSNTCFYGVSFDGKDLGIFHVGPLLDIWWDQVEFFNSDGWDALRNGEHNAGATPLVAAAGTRLAGYSTECYMHDWSGSMANIALVRNADWTDCPSDVVTNVACVDGGVFRNVKTGRLRANTPALNISYSGTGTPRILISRNTSGTAFTQQLQVQVDGVTVSGGTLPVTQSFGAGTFLPSDVAPLIDALPDFTCSVPEGGDIKALRYAVNGSSGYVTSQIVTFVDGQAVIYTSMDVHQDWWQGHRGGVVDPIENIILDGCRLVNAEKMQGILTGDTHINDMLIRNVVIDTSLEPSGAPHSQFNRDKSHLVIENSAWTLQAVTTSGAFDDYCSFYGTVFARLAISGQNFEIDRCLFMDGVVPGWATNSATGGDRATLWSDMDSLEPLGLLLDNPAPPRAPYDAFGNLRDPSASALGPVGAPSEYEDVDPGEPIVIGPMTVGKAGGAQHSFSLTINPAA